MTKQELIDLLKYLPEDADIRIDHPTHDYWRTHIAMDITAIDEVKIKTSSYHNNMDVVDDEEDWDNSLKSVFLIR